MENILFGLIPAFMWGIQPLVMTRLGGRPTRKVMGMAMGIFLASILVFFFRRPENLTWSLVVWSFVDGLALSYGLINQIRGLYILGVSKGTPISTGSQLVGAALIGAIYFKEWTSLNEYVLGITALVLIILGVSMTAFEEKEGAGGTGDRRKGILSLLLSSLGFVAYTVILRVTDISIWDALVFQGLGMLVGSYFLSRKEEEGSLFTRETWSHIITGLIFAMGNISLMLSNVRNGLALGFTLTQMNVVIATLGGLLFLREEKTKKELFLTLLGLVLVVLGGVLIGITKKG